MITIKKIKEIEKELTSSNKRKTCVLYFLSNFYFFINDDPSNTMKDVFNFV